VPFTANGKTVLAYELDVTNTAVQELALTRLEASVNEADQAALVYERGDLAKNTKPASQTLKAGARAVIFCWIDLPGAAAWSRLRNQLFYRQGAETRSVQAEPEKIDAASGLALGTPFAAGDWWAAVGPSNASEHRRAQVRVNGDPEAPFAQRYAIDWIELCDGRFYANGGKANTDFCAYGKDLLAVADATVAAVKDGIPDNKPGENSRAVKITLDTLLGNRVALDLGNHLYAVYAHLQPGSLQVKAGDRVHRGQAIGKLGNSGNSDAPHLHFHVAQADSVEQAETAQSRPYPYQFDAFEFLGRYSGNGAMKPGVAQTRTHELALDGDVVRFKQ
jgi:murein DD-endopeptidase MepM/ murein hydrolase activator NlpD